jgi:hypothetical protein
MEKYSKSQRKTTIPIAIEQKIQQKLKLKKNHKSNNKKGSMTREK